MSRRKKDDSVSIRLRLKRDLLNRIDKIAGDRGRQRFIEDAIAWRMDQELPPAVYKLIEEVDQLRLRVEHLEGAQPIGAFTAELNDTVKTQICRDDFDRRLLGYFLQHQGATTPELATFLLDDVSKRRTVLDRIDKLNKRAKKLIGVEVLEYEKGIVRGKRGAWWVININKITQ
ncbi:MAG: hypothetical protein ACFE7R_05295 [Candidatus Hodarchaeota archaeon]